MLAIGDFARYGRVSVRMLRLREAEIENQIAASEARLAHVRARLALIAEESACTDVLLKRIPAVRVAELSGIAKSMDPE